MSTDGSSSPPRVLRADAERNRQLILDTARRAFAARGLGVRLDEIADAAGIGVGTVYRRFRDKDELIAELFTQTLDEVVALSERVLSEDTDGTGLRRFFEQVFAITADDRGLQQMLTGVPNASQQLAVLGRARIEPRVTALVVNARAGGHLRSDLEHGDMPVVQIMLSAAMEATSGVRADLRPRYVALVLDALEPQAEISPLPGHAPSGEEIQTIVSRWRPQPRQPGAHG